MEQEQVAVMTVEFGVSRQPQSYQSVRCSVTMPVFVKPGDDAGALAQDALRQAVIQVRAQVDDEYERGYEKPAVYSKEQRFCAVTVKEERLVVLAPWNEKFNMPGGWARQNAEFTEHRLNVVCRKVEEEYPRYVVIDCTDGDWSVLPGLEEFEVWTYQMPWNKETGPGPMWVLARPGAQVPGKNDYPGRWYSNNYFRLYGEEFLKELRKKAAKDEAL